MVSPSSAFVTEYAQVQPLLPSAAAFSVASRVQQPLRWQVHICDAPEGGGDGEVAQWGSGTTLVSGHALGQRRTTYLIDQVWCTRQVGPIHPSTWPPWTA